MKNCLKGRFAKQEGPFTMKILLVDDDKTLVKGIVRSFRGIGHEVVACYEGTTVLDTH